MSKVLLALQGLNKAYGGIRATQNVSLDVRENEIHALIGPNGAGKSTLISQIFGNVRPDAGSVLWQGENISNLPVHMRVRLGLARSFQISSVLSEFSALENVEMAVRGGQKPWSGVWQSAKKSKNIREQAHECLERIGLLDRANTKVAYLSYGEMRQVELAMMLGLKPKVALLDEPMAGVGPEESRNLTQILAGLKNSLGILLVEHDMDVVQELADRVSVLVGGKIIASGTPEEMRNDPIVIQNYVGEVD